MNGLSLTGAILLLAFAQQGQALTCNWGFSCGSSGATQCNTLSFGNFVTSVTIDCNGANARCVTGTISGNPTINIDVLSLTNGGTPVTNLGTLNVTLGAVNTWSSYLDGASIYSCMDDTTTTFFTDFMDNLVQRSSSLSSFPVGVTTLNFPSYTSELSGTSNTFTVGATDNTQTFSGVDFTAAGITVSTSLAGEIRVTTGSFSYIHASCTTAQCNTISGSKMIEVSALTILLGLLSVFKGL